MNHDPEAWAVLGRAIRSDRNRQGINREQLAKRVRERGGDVSARTIGSLERGVEPKRGAKPPSLEPTVAALGWKAGWTDRILGGEDPGAVLEGVEPEPAEEVTPKQRLYELLPSVYEFARTAVLIGAPAEERDAFEVAAQRLLNAATSGARQQGGYALAAYRPHAAGEGVPADDAARIREALNGDG
ncbi:helix-turn-helix transcriptional regulator [Streptomyces sp. E5N91]|uniref:helix-turn-helix domain-containing protein n=1 Tax=Streptomyces sp. E5N91 TaxID=1851996 RepID=UPI000EF5F003|nr:helix-turn-helix transcriptional regulator [Streptomyces sp. E5N91]